MADEITTPTDGEIETSEGQPGPVPYTRFKEINDGYKALKAQLEQLAAERKKEDEDKLAEQQKWQELAQRREAELKSERLERLRLQAALAKGLPAELSSRLQGESEQDLLTDAEKLAQMLAQQVPPPPGVPPRHGATPPTSITSQQLRDPKWVRENQTKILQAARDGKLPG